MTESPNNKVQQSKRRPNRSREKTLPKIEDKQMPNVGPAADTNKYAPKEKIGTPTLGRSPNYVTRVGLGNLKTITYGNPDVQP